MSDPHLKTISDMLSELEGTSSKNDKKAILKKYDSVQVRDFLTYALDPYKKFYMRKIPSHTPAVKSSLTLGAMISDLDDLMHRRVTGHDAIDQIADTLSKLSVRDGDIFQRMLQKDLRCGTNVSTVNDVMEDLIPEFNVQLAAVWDADKITWPRLVEPKIDGMRCLAFLEGPNPEDVVFYTRKGKPIETMAALAQPLLDLFPVGSVIDGEAKNSFGTFEESMSKVKRGTVLEDADIVFTVFDMLTASEFTDQLCTLPYDERRRRFVPILQAAANKNVTYLPNVFIENEEQAADLFASYRKLGYEGLILKDPKGTYDFKRNRTWMKMKPSETMDVEITGYEEGTKSNTGMLGAFKFMYNGLECKAGGGFSKDERKEFWALRDKMIGDLMEVQFMEKTAKGRTRHCNFVKLRTFKGEKV